MATCVHRPRPPRTQANGVAVAGGDAAAATPAGAAAAAAGGDAGAASRSAGARGDRPRREKRQFDHHVPGNGRPIGEQKKGGAGKGNWGKVDDAADASTAVAAAATTEGAAAATAAAADGDKAAAGEGAAPAAAAAEPEVPEIKGISLDEYLAKRNVVIRAAPVARKVVSDICDCLRPHPFSLSLPLSLSLLLSLA